MRTILALLALACIVACGDDSFYTDPVAHLEDYAPGEIIRFEHIRHTSAFTLGLKGRERATSGAHVYRVMYRTVGVDGAPDMASARLAVPDELDPQAPLLVHLHGTVGLADRCAPSRDHGFGFESSSNPFAAWAAGQGWPVIEPDYLGLGPPGRHPYVARIPTATSVLDAIRSVSLFDDPDRGPAKVGARSAALVGHSQGGHAVLSTLALAAEGDNPDIDIVSAVAISPPGAPDQLFEHMIREDQWGGFLAMAMFGLTTGHPELGEPQDWINDEKLLEDINDKCLIGLGGQIDVPPSEVLSESLLGESDEMLEAVFAVEDLGDLSTEVPLLVAHGSDDELLPIALTEQYTERMAQAGTNVQFLPVEGGDHLFLPSKVREEVVTFLLDTVW